jgi:hypothetical protein
MAYSYMRRQTESGFAIFDVFESRDAVDRFNASMQTIPREVGQRSA